MTDFLHHCKSNKLTKSIVYRQAYDDEWNMYTMTYNGSYVSVYSGNVFVDGEAITGKPFSITTTVHRMLLLLLQLPCLLQA